MTTHRLINGMSVTKYILYFIVITLVSFGLSYWSFKIFMNQNQVVQKNIEQLGSVFIFPIMHYAFLICAIGIFICALFFVSAGLQKLFTIRLNSFILILDKVLIKSMLFFVFMIAPFIIFGQSYTNYKFSQAGYTQCNALMVKDRFDRAWVLNSEDCYDRKLRSILLQRGKKKAVALQEAYAYLHDKHQIIDEE
ncbi:hypothetical protein [Nitrincola sp. MINF-07-Sa-05]|uniref:hypothetical protein n=1 Tax=Nitrincola salilacus TaxID=3400273 RepID=UPI003917BF80